MRLYIDQKVFSWTDKFTVRDGAGSERYTVEGELFSFGKKLHVYDRTGREVAFIKQEVWSFMPRYYVYVAGQEVAQIVKEFTFFFPKYRVDGLDWEIEGSFMEHDYHISANARGIASLHKEWMTWGDCYQLDIYDPADELPALAVVLAIDCVLAAQAAANNS